MESTLTLNGPYSDNYVKEDRFGVESTVWSPCGVEGMLNINSEVRITPLSSKNVALMTVIAPGDVEIRWQAC